MPLNSDRGYWKDGVRGEGLFVIHDAAEFHYNGHTITGAEFKAMYGVEGIEYHNSEPDFSPFYLNNSYVDTVVFENGISHDRDQTHQAALSYLSEKKGRSKAAIEKYMKQNEFTFHELDDRKTVVVIPSCLNSIFTHTGGTGLEKIIEALRRSMQIGKTGVTYRLCSNFVKPVSVNSKEVQMAVNHTRARIKRIRRNSQKG